MTEDLPVEIQLALAYEKARDPDGREALGAVLDAIAADVARAHAEAFKPMARTA